MVRTVSFVFFSAVACWSLAVSKSESVFSQSGEVQIVAENQQRLANGTVQAEGNAVLTTEDLTIEADLISFEPASTAQVGPEARARGNVTFRRSGDVLKCSELRLNLSSGRGEFQRHDARPRVRG